MLLAQNNYQFGMGLEIATDMTALFRRPGFSPLGGRLCELYVFGEPLTEAALIVVSDWQEVKHIDLKMPKVNLEMIKKNRQQSKMIKKKPAWLNTFA